jgi:hypothetical protein
VMFSEGVAVTFGSPTPAARPRAVGGSFPGRLRNP